MLYPLSYEGGRSRIVAGQRVGAAVAVVARGVAGWWSPHGPAARAQREGRSSRRWHSPGFRTVSGMGGVGSS